MLLWPEVQGQAARLVRGVLSPSGELDEVMLDACGSAYKRCCFVSTGVKGLRGIANFIDDAVRDHQLMDKGDAPTRQVMMQAVDEKPVSLRALLSIVSAVSILKNDGPKIPQLIRGAEILNRTFPLNDIFPSNSFEPAIFVPDPEEVRGLRKMILENDREAWSEEMYEGASLKKEKKRSALGLIEDGYASGNASVRGWHTLTEDTAKRLHKVFDKKLGANLVGPLEHFAPISGIRGPRSGQVTRALSISDGNLVPKSPPKLI